MLIIWLSIMWHEQLWNRMLQRSCSNFRKHLQILQGASRHVQLTDSASLAVAVPPA